MQLLVWLDVGWISFLILCCFFPMMRSYYNRQRNARDLDENFSSIQSRLAEIERQRTNGSDGSNSRQDWECLDEIFGTNNTSAASPLRAKLVDILSCLGYFWPMVETWNGFDRKQEQGRKLVAALKGTSVMVHGCDLVEKDQSRQEDICGKVEGLDNCAEGDVEMGCVTYDQNVARSSHIVISSVAKEEEYIKRNLQETKSDRIRSDVESEEDGGQLVMRHGSDLEKGNEGKSKTSHNALGSEENCASPQSTNNTTINSRTDSDTSISSPQTNSGADESPPSLVVAMQMLPLQDDDKLHGTELDDWLCNESNSNKYVALCLPCNSTITQAQRLVPPTCAICLGEYEPGSFVSWSPNKMCTHAFHRDCIFMWLLKQEEPLCPCCRREFVPRSTMNGDSNNGNVATTAAAAAAENNAAIVETEHAS